MSQYTQARPAHIRETRRAVPTDEYAPSMEQEPQMFVDANLAPSHQPDQYLSYPELFGLAGDIGATPPSCRVMSDECFAAPPVYTYDVFSPNMPNQASAPVRVAAHFVPFSTHIVHPNPNNNKAPLTCYSPEQLSGYDLQMLINAGVMSSDFCSSSSSSATDGTPPTASDSSPEVRHDATQDFRIACLTAEQRPIYQDLLRHPRQNSASIESILSIAARGNIKPLRKEITSFLHISVLPETKSGKGSRVGLKKYQCSLCPELNTDRWDTAEYHIHSHLGLKVFPCLVERCGYSFRRPHELKNHEETIHKLFKPSAQHGGRRVPADSTEAAYGPYPSGPNRRNASNAKASFAVSMQTASAAPGCSTGMFAYGKNI